MVAVIGTTQKFVNPQEDNAGVDAIFSDIYGNPNFVEPFGNGGASMTRQGNTMRFVSAGANPSTINGLYVVSAITFPANTFDVAGRGVAISAMGSVANNTNSKTISIYWGATTAVVGSLITGGTLIASTGAYTTTGAAAWQMLVNIFKYGAGGSNTQVSTHETAQIGTTLPALTVPQLLTAPENAAITVALVCNAVTAVTDIAVMNFIITGMC
jgi:hypothetical protein